jgi:hypothetical protein
MNSDAQPMRNRSVRRGLRWRAGVLLRQPPSKPAPGRHEAIEAEIGDEIAVMQGVMICDLGQDEYLVRLAPQKSAGSFRCASVNPEYTPSQ